MKTTITTFMINVKNITDVRRYKYDSVDILAVHFIGGSKVCYYAASKKDIINNKWYYFSVEDTWCFPIASTKFLKILKELREKLLNV